LLFWLESHCVKASAEDLLYGSSKILFFPTRTGTGVCLKKPLAGTFSGWRLCASRRAGATPGRCSLPGTRRLRAAGPTSPGRPSWSGAEGSSRRAWPASRPAAGLPAWQGSCPGFSLWTDAVAGLHGRFHKARLNMGLQLLWIVTWGVLVTVFFPLW